MKFIKYLPLAIGLLSPTTHAKEYIGLRLCEPTSIEKIEIVASEAGGSIEEGLPFSETADLPGNVRMDIKNYPIGAKRYTVSLSIFGGIIYYASIADSPDLKDLLIDKYGLPYKRTTETSPIGESLTFHFRVRGDSEIDLGMNYFSSNSGGVYASVFYECRAASKRYMDAKLKHFKKARDAQNTGKSL